jgi:hypothetical protein
MLTKTIPTLGRTVPAVVVSMDLILGLAMALWHGTAYAAYGDLDPGPD